MPPKRTASAEDVTAKKKTRTRKSTATSATNNDTDIVEAVSSEEKVATLLSDLSKEIGEAKTEREAERIRTASLEKQILVLQADKVELEDKYQKQEEKYQIALSKIVQGTTAIRNIGAELRAERDKVANVESGAQLLDEETKRFKQEMIKEREQQAQKHQQAHDAFLRDCRYYNTLVKAVDDLMLQTKGMSFATFGGFGVSLENVRRTFSK